MLCYCYGSVSDQFGPAFNKFDLIWFEFNVHLRKEGAVAKNPLMLYIA